MEGGDGGEDGWSSSFLSEISSDGEADCPQRRQTEDGGGQGRPGAAEHRVLFPGVQFHKGILGK